MGPVSADCVIRNSAGNFKVSKRCVSRCVYFITSDVFDAFGLNNILAFKLSKRYKYTYLLIPVCMISCKN